MPDLEILSLSSPGARLCDVRSFEAALRAVPKLYGLMVDNLGVRSARAIAMATPKLRFLSTCRCSIQDRVIDALCSVVKPSLTGLIMYNGKQSWEHQLRQAFPNMDELELGPG